MRKFSMVSPRVWQSKKFRGLSNDAAKLLYLYLITSNHGNAAGCYHIPAGYAATDTGTTETDLIASRSELVDAELILFDEGTDEIFIPNWYSFNTPATEKHVAGIRHNLERIDSERLFTAAECELGTVERQIIEKKERAEAEKLAKEISGKHGLGIVNGGGRVNDLSSKDYRPRGRVAQC